MKVNWLLLHTLECYLNFCKVVNEAIGKGEDIKLIIQDIGVVKIPLSSIHVF